MFIGCLHLHITGNCFINESVQGLFTLEDNLAELIIQ